MLSRSVQNPKRSRCTRAFTLADMILTVGILAMLMAISVPSLTRAGLRVREQALKANLKAIRDAMDSAMADTGVYVNPPDLTSATPPSGGWVPGPVGQGWAYSSLPPGAKWNGPYLKSIPKNPVNGNASVVSTSPNNSAGWCWNSNPAFIQDAFWPCSPDLSTEGTPYYSW